MTSKSLIAGLGLAAVAGCMSMHNGSSADFTAAIDAFSRRADDHHARVTAATDRSAVLAELDSYVPDMSGLMERMMTACQNSMDAMMPSRSDPSLVADVMSGFIRQHDRDMRAEPDL